MENSAHDDQHGHADQHAPFQAHHFDTMEQQFQAGKLGMWIFLVTEILLFGGLFCAYAAYRANHPQIFAYAAEEFLDKTLGAINTAVLIFSSLTMAWGVRCAQLNRQRALVVLLSITLLCGVVFLCIKYVEYKHKWEEGLLWARQYDPHTHVEAGHPDAKPAPGATSTPSKDQVQGQPGAAVANPAPAGQLPASTGGTGLADVQPPVQSQMVVLPSAAARGSHHDFRTEPKNVGVFFSIYFMMTGLHGVHVIAGMGAIGWVLWRATKGHFGASYFGPVDYVGLYWHLVDLIWIYLFPLLYLIH